MSIPSQLHGIEEEVAGLQGSMRRFQTEQPAQWDGFVSGISAMVEAVGERYHVSREGQGSSS